MPRRMPLAVIFLGALTCAAALGLAGCASQEAEQAGASPEHEAEAARDGEFAAGDQTADPYSSPPAVTGDPVAPEHVAEQPLDATSPVGSAPEPNDQPSPLPPIAPDLASGGSAPRPTRILPSTALPPTLNPPSAGGGNLELRRLPSVQPVTPLSAEPLRVRAFGELPPADQPGLTPHKLTPNSVQPSSVEPNFVGPNSVGPGEPRMAMSGSAPAAEEASAATATAEPAEAGGGELPESGDTAEAIEADNPPVSATLEPTDPPDAEYTTLEVFYGTDRRPVEVIAHPGKIPVPREYFPAFGLAAVALLVLSGALYPSRRRAVWAVCGATLLMGALALGGRSYLQLQAQGLAHAEKGRVYGNERGTLELGTCHVSIPRTHQVGRLEAPSILRLEIREDARKHVMLRSVMRREDDEFYQRLRQRVTQSPQRDLFVFVHGYNVTFEDAARRTAQIAYDLRFPGAAVFYSWPSQGGLLKYTVDETNVEWTVPHLKQFLLDVSRNSGASAVNLVAHSMGNRALTDALRELRYELRGETLFNQVVLAAPDIDADIFRRDIAPAIRSTARRVTLYASSDDQALIASKNVHGYARAGDSGSGLVVIPGIETIDVSGIDTSLLGHSYYGSSHSILADLYEVIRRGQPPAARAWLVPMLLDGLTYWRLKSESHEVALPPSTLEQR